MLLQATLQSGIFQRTTLPVFDTQKEIERNQKMLVRFFILKLYLQQKNCH